MTTNVSKLFTSPIPDYDPFNTYKEQQPASRVSGKGIDNYMKSRGSFSINDWTSQSDNMSPRSKKTEDADIVRDKNDGERLSPLNDRSFSFNAFL